MTQVTWRAPDELVERVRRLAAEQGRSMNDLLTAVMAAATDPALAGNEAERVRERLAAAGLLVPAPRQPVPRRRPGREEFARARRAAGKGTSLAELVERERG